jgi:hypothetical protein
VRRLPAALILVTAVLGSSRAQSQNLLPLGPEIDLADEAEKVQFEPVVGVDDTGSWWAIWGDLRPAYDLSYRDFDAQGNAGPQLRFDDDALPSAGFRGAEAGRRGARAGWWISLPPDVSHGYYAQVARLRPPGEDEFEASFELAPPDANFIFSGHGDIAYAADGTFVAVWGGTVDFDLHEVDIFARRFDGEGHPLTEVIHVNQSTLGVQGSARTASDGWGNFVVVWQDTYGYDGSMDGIFARRFSRAGVPLGPEFPVNQTTQYRQDFPDVAMDPNGEFLVVWSGWEHDDVYYDVWARRYKRNGEPKGDEYRVNQFRRGSQWLPRIDMDSAGNYVVAWDAYTWRDERKSIIARAYRADGTPLGDEFAAQSSNLGFSGNSYYSRVALSDSGVVVFSWTAYEGSLEREEDARARRFVWPCVADDASLCLGGRFLVRAQRRTPSGSFDGAHALPVGGDSGVFWFFAPENLELYAKVLDGCGVNGRFWVYLAGLTDVEVDVEVTDTWTGEVEVYRTDLLERFPAIQDVEAFDGCGVAPPEGAATPVPLPTEALPNADPVSQEEEATGCGGAQSTRLCLDGGRFRASANYRVAGGEPTIARAIQATEASGFFWFFDPSNLELAVKLLDGCVPFGTRWFYAAGLTDLEVELRVADLLTGEVRYYRSPAGTPFAPIHDAAAFATCP